MYRYKLMENYPAYFIADESGDTIVTSNKENGLNTKTFRFLPSNVEDSMWIEDSLSIREILEQFGDDCQIKIFLRGQTLYLNGNDIVIPYESNEEVILYGDNLGELPYIDKEIFPENLEDYTLASKPFYQIYVKEITEDSQPKDLYVKKLDGSEKYYTAFDRDDIDSIRLLNFNMNDCSHVILTPRIGINIYTFLGLTEHRTRSFFIDELKPIVYKAPFMHYL